MMAEWTEDETRALLKVWGAEDVQNKLDRVVRNRTIYEQIARELAALGFERTWQQCRTRSKNLIKRYRKVKDNNNTSGKGRISCPCYNELDEILGTRAASTPPVVLDSGTLPVPESQEGDTTECDIEQDLEGESILQSDDNSPLSSTETTQQSASTDGSSVSTSKGKHKRREEINARKRGQKRKHVESEIFLDHLTNLIESAEERAAEREIRMRELELEMERKMREREEQREERMLSMFNQVFMHLTGGSGSNSIYQHQHPDFSYSPPPPSPFPIPHHRAAFCEHPQNMSTSMPLPTARFSLDEQ